MRMCISPAVTHMSAGIRFLVITLSAILLASALASASGPGYGVKITPENTDAEASGDTCAQFNATVENTGTAPLDHEISLSVDAGDSGWGVGEAPTSSLSLAAGESADVSFTGCPGSEAADGETATFTLTAEVTSDPSGEKATASQDFTGRYVALAGTQDGMLDGNETDGEDLSGDQGNETGGESGESPGPALVALLGTLFAVAALRRRQA